ncbi:hypothetical protein HMPREF1199_01305 [Hoylesella oralis CC98A]|nr:hypothetical protein HMPREF1199_01305 [Hoylesella oralis CC98A]
MSRICTVFHRYNDFYDKQTVLLPPADILPNNHRRIA